ncbi:MAG: hypothetical protein ACRD2L_19525, partial [Terriglobia bacterium]
EEQIYDLKRRELDALIADRLLAHEAARRGMSVAALLDAEGTAKVALVTEKEIEAFYQANKAQLQGDEATAREQIRAQLQNQKLAIQRDAFLRSLRSQAKVVVHLKAPPVFRAQVGPQEAPFKGGVTAPVTIVKSEHVHAETLELQFRSLSTAQTNRCAGPDFIYSKTDGERLQGSCCSPMDFHRYVEQVEGLRKYSHLGKIPSDPYDIPVSLAKTMLEDQRNIRLAADQQAVYDDAMKFSHEGGPCCCKCWRWHAFEGLGKYLVTEHNFNAEQLAEVWDLADGCGGKGHVHGEGHSH